MNPGLNMNLPLTAPSWTLTQVAQLAEGTVRPPEAGGASFGASQIALDSRTIRRGDFFVALRGDRFDGHDFLPQVAEAQALGALVHRPLEGVPLSQVVVESTEEGWRRWGAGHRRRFPHLQLVGMTGSSGKTTTKDILAHLLQGAGPVLATQGNRNNQIGVPWTLLGIGPDHRFAVVEMGMNHPGEIARHSGTAAPSLGLLTSVGTAHVGNLGSREAVLQAKLEILEGMPEGAPLILPYDPWIQERLPAAARKQRIRTFGFDPAADVGPVGPVQLTLHGTRFDTPLTGPIGLSLLGLGGVLSCLAALATLSALNLDARLLAKRLESVPVQPLRMERRRLAGAEWILDCYNASPESTRLAIRFLREVPHSGRRILVLGELGELGHLSERIHQELGRQAGGVETVLFVGEGARPAFRANREAALSSSISAWVSDAEDAAAWLKPRLRPEDLVLLKGSRKIALERIVDLLGGSENVLRRKGGD